jgi:hypothetical protein
MSQQKSHFVKPTQIGCDSMECIDGDDQVLEA